MRILAIGPSPPPALGTSIPFELMCESLRSRYKEFSVIDTNAISRIGPFRWLFSGEALRAFWLTLNAHAILLAVSRPKIFILGSALVVFGWLTRKRILIRNFGGDLDQWYLQGDRVRRFAIYTMLHAEVVFLETKLLMEFAKKVYPRARTTWLANYRVRERSIRSPGHLPTVDGVWSDLTKLRLIFVGHVSHAKGVGVLCKAMEQCRGFASLILCGKLVDRDLVDSIDRAGARLMGEIDNESVMALLEASDVLVCPSNAPNEGHPGVIAEAFMYGKPVVASNWRSIPEVVTADENGYLFEAGNPDSLAAKIREIADPIRRAALAKGATSSRLLSDSAHWQKVIVGAVDAGLST